MILPFNTSIRRTNSTNRAGFTFVEVLAAMVFMGILIPVVLQGLAVANRAGVAAERRVIASRLGNNFLNQYSISNQWQNAPNSGNFAPEFPTFSFNLEQTSWDVDTMREMRLRITYPVQSVPYSITLSTLVNESQ